MQVAALKGMHVGELLTSWREFSLAVHITQADNVLRGMSAAAGCLEAASASTGMLSYATVFFTRAMGRKLIQVSS
jgi:hypothetical protein